eukprot:TRINITY_DN12119_c0_g1_i1.p1 TRINITY_DN12119_c0_g1~~TRINITY_DN12119_c0_g1_i1.p1  ORF type:complete len:135 (+),score=33.37 TRINITY_DN12119_c0_g1_i1:107-511(+)
MRSKQEFVDREVARLIAEKKKAQVAGKFNMMAMRSRMREGILQEAKRRKAEEDGATPTSATSDSAQSPAPAEDAPAPPPMDDGPPEAPPTDDVPAAPDDGPPPAPGMDDGPPPAQIGRAVQQECRDRSRMPSSA